MKFTDMKSGNFYKRKSDGAFFQKAHKDLGGHYLKINSDGKWEKTEDLHFSDQLVHTHENPGVETFEDMFLKYRNGDAHDQKHYLDKLLLGLARKADQK